VCGVLVAGGGIGKYVEKRAELDRLQLLYAGLAGSIAHELRTPLAQIQFTIDQAAARLPPNSDAVPLLAQGKHAVRRGLQAIAITLQQINGKALNADDFVFLSAAQCVSRAMDSYVYESDQARERVYLQVDEDFHFRGDATAFELVLFNLLKNALYYLPLHPRMHIRIRVAQHPKPCIVFRDTGPGIDPSLLPRLFGEFETSGKAQGTGLGLAFCRRVMHSFGGTIECRSELGSFTEFTLSLPMRSSQEDSEPVQSDAMPCTLQGRTLLVVDDEAFNRAVVKALLSELGANVMEAEHGEQALSVLRSGCLPDAILMDVNMPGLDGMATTRQLRSLPGATGRVPVLAVTANDSPIEQIRASEAGMQALLAKPIEPGALARELAQLLGDIKPADGHRTMAAACGTGSLRHPDARD
jgi:CheY-like chemotaxis protein